MTNRQHTVSPATISALVLEATDVAGAEAFYAALGLTDRVRVRATAGASSGFRGYTLSLVVSRPGIVDAFVRAAVGAGATEVKPAQKSLWGYGGSLRAPDGTVWTIASSEKKHDGEPGSLAYDDLVLLLGVADVKATRQFYVDHGLEVARGFGSKYVEFKAPGRAIKLALQSRRAVAKNAGVDAEGTGSHRLAIVSDVGPFTDPDGFGWEVDPAGTEAD